MFAREVSIRLKSNMLPNYNWAFENEVLPLLRKQKGFQDELILSNPGSPDVIAISLWDSKTSADTYNTIAYPEVLIILGTLIDGTPKVQTFQTVTSTSHKIAAAA